MKEIEIYVRSMTFEYLPEPGRDDWLPVAVWHNWPHFYRITYESVTGETVSISAHIVPPPPWDAVPNQGKVISPRDLLP
jgi:hypothetical protein